MHLGQGAKPAGKYARISLGEQTSHPKKLVLPPSTQDAGIPMYLAIE
jgi:hypothetical protein